MRAVLLASFLGLAMAAAPGTARAEPASGNDLLWVCQHYGCESEIIRLTQAVMRDQKAGAPYTTASDPVCFRQETTWSQIVAVVQGQLSKHPETLQQDVHPLVLSYLAAAFPCVPT